MPPMDSYDQFMKKYLAKKWGKALRELKESQSDEPQIDREFKTLTSDEVKRPLEINVFKDLEKADEWEFVTTLEDDEGNLLYKKPVHEEPVETLPRQPYNVKDRTPSKWTQSGVHYIKRRLYPNANLTQFGEKIREYGCTECDFTEWVRWKVEIHLEVEHKLSFRPDRPVRGCHGCHKSYAELFKAKKWDDYHINALAEIHHDKCGVIQERIKSAPVTGMTADVAEEYKTFLTPEDANTLNAGSNNGLLKMYHVSGEPQYIDKITTAYRSEVMTAIMRHRR